MENKQSARFLRQRKMMVVLPLLVIPFITMAFWALGGGKANSTDDETKLIAGLNLQLPNANLKNDKIEDKLSFYNEAMADSLKRAEFLRNDPYYIDSLQEKESLMDFTENLYNPSDIKHGLNTSPYQTRANSNEQKIYQKIDEINKQLNQVEEKTPQKEYPEYPGSPYEGSGQFSKDVDRMEEMMQMINNNQEPDPEMQQLNGTLEKILDIQHPERLKDKLKEKSLLQKESVFVISKTPVQNNISLLDTSKNRSNPTTGFYGLEDNISQSEENTAAEAVVHSNQSLINGTIIKLRLTTNIYVDGKLIPNGNFIYGIVSLNDERLEIEITSIRSSNSIFPVKLEVYDMDGLAGIHIPGAIARDVAKQSSDNGLQLMELTSVDPSFKAQAAAAGINTAKSLMSKKVKLVRVEVKAGYKVLLKNKNLQQ